jgi:hypothetical protein
MCYHRISHTSTDIKHMHSLVDVHNSSASSGAPVLTPEHPSFVTAVQYLKLASDVAQLNFSTLNPLQSPTAFVTATPSPALLAAVPAAVMEALTAAAAAAAAAAAPPAPVPAAAPPAPAPAVTVAALLQHLAALRREARHRCEHLAADVSARPLTRTAGALQAALCEHLPGYAAATTVVVPAATATAVGGSSGGTATAAAQLGLAEGEAVGTLVVLMPEGAAAGENALHACANCISLLTMTF